MPLFGHKKQRKEDSKAKENISQETASLPRVEKNAVANPSSRTPEHTAKNGQEEAQVNDPPAPVRPKLVFHCQLAHGSHTGLISDFSNVTELYQRIADCFKITPDEIMFCTLNTHKIDMKQLLGGQLGLEDFIFAHCKGQPKVVDILKTEEALGLTITDNGAGCSFIKAIKPNSIIAGIEGINPGDHVEKIGDVKMFGCRHVDVAKALREIPRGSTFALRLVEPMKSGFSAIGGKSNGGSSKKAGYGTGKETLRLKSKGTASVEVADDVASTAIDKINGLMEGFLGISDAELAQTIWETGNEKSNPSDFAQAIDDSDLGAFGFTDAFIFDLWGAISDAKQGRLQKMQNFSESF